MSKVIVERADVPPADNPGDVQIIRSLHTECSRVVVEDDDVHHVFSVRIKKWLFDRNRRASPFRADRNFTTKISHRIAWLASLTTIWCADSQIRGISKPFVLRNGSVSKQERRRPVHPSRRSVASSGRTDLMRTKWFGVLLAASRRSRLRPGLSSRGASARSRR